MTANVRRLRITERSFDSKELTALDVPCHPGVRSLPCKLGSQLVLAVQLISFLGADEDSWARSLWRACSESGDATGTSAWPLLEQAPAAVLAAALEWYPLVRARHADDVSAALTAFSALPAMCHGPATRAHLKRWHGGCFEPSRALSAQADDRQNGQHIDGQRLCLRRQSAAALTMLAEVLPEMRQVRWISWQISLPARQHKKNNAAFGRALTCAVAMPALDALALHMHTRSTTAAVLRAFAHQASPLATAPQLTALHLRAVSCDAPRALPWRRHRAAAAVTRSVRSLRGLRHLALSGCGVDCAAAGTLADSLAQLRGLVSLDLSSNRIGARGAAALAPAIAQLPLLAALSAANNHSGVGARRACANLTRLQLSSAWLHMVVAAPTRQHQHVRSATIVRESRLNFRALSRLVMLTMSHASDASISALLSRSQLRALTQLQTLTLEHMPRHALSGVPIAHAHGLAAALTALSRLSSLRLTRHGFDARATSVLAPVIAQMPRLQAFNYDRGHVPLDSLLAPSPSLVMLRSLADARWRGTHLSLSHDTRFVYRATADRVGRWLQALPALQALELVGDGINSAAAARLLTRLRPMPALTRLDLRENELGAWGVRCDEQVRTLQQTRPRLTVLLEGNALGGSAQRRLQGAAARVGRQRRSWVLAARRFVRWGACVAAMHAAAALCTGPRVSAAPQKRVRAAPPRCGSVSAAWQVGPFLVPHLTPPQLRLLLDLRERPGWGDWGALAARGRGQR
jgi:Leucine Rich repeat